MSFSIFVWPTEKRGLKPVHLFETHITSIALENTEPIRQKKSSLFLSLCNWKIYAKALRGGYLQKNGSRGALRFCIG